MQIILLTTYITSCFVFIKMFFYECRMDISAHNYRGHVVVSKKNEISRNVQYYPYDNKPLWFVFSGLGSQWLGMGYYLIKIPVLLASIQK